MMITLLAAPRIERLPAMVLPAASASNPPVSTEAWDRIGKYRATSGTLEMNWLRMTLTLKTMEIETILCCVSVRKPWKNPEFHTLSMSMNIAAKKPRCANPFF